MKQVIFALAGLVLAGCAQERVAEDTSFAKSHSLGDARQVVWVTTDSQESFRAVVRTLEKEGSQWKLVGGPMAAVIGRNGFAEDKREGDGKSPVGVFTVGTFFGKKDKPQSVTFPYRQVTANDFWVDDPNSVLYNTWQTGPAAGRWESAENLLRKDSFYDYAIVINYNTYPVIAGRGSAIFMHVWGGPAKGTSGCVALSEENLLKLMLLLDPAKKPVIVMEPCQKKLNH